ncbi:WGR and DUF4132 domain-containing protein [Streptomyces sp. NBC_01363]|uniref:WGR and DUF4132 domain-containing protein n=1 Tax=Streptomyces sp. NBC_01363 TaxID=2903840 RepID=UPI00225B3A40|nr:DUF4132 domain-containing protein [Streptomyces sp. NBC_01363]MCX4736029.1 DUF4132 domain-containing protein [Streptomyces sp. NBC_01363]
MRRWEYVEGTASKFWETEAEGAVVTVRYGRCGSDGRTQTKEYASAEAATAQVVRTIAEKEKKGYREVGASASAPAAPAATAPATAPDEVTDEGAPVLPDEDTFTLPASWKRVLHPRRGGVRRGPVKVRREAFDTIEARLAENAAWIQEFADSPRSDAAVAQSLRAHLGTDPSPVGAAALTAIVDAPGWADFWSERYGLPFAARTATEVFSVDADWQQSGLKRGAPRLLALPAPRHAYWSWHHRAPIDRVRALLAAADEETYRAAVEALAECRTDTLRKIIVSYLVPSETDWVDELCADPAVSAEQDRTLRAMVFSSLYSADQLALLPYRPDFTLGVAVIATVAEGIGPAVSQSLADTLDGNHYYSDNVKLAADALAELPTDEAFLGLLAHADSKHVRPSLLEAMRRYPVRAVRLLAAEAGGRSAAASRSLQLLRSHVGAHRELLTPVLDGLGPEVVEIVDPLLNPADLIADAPADALPAVLTAPPWSRPRTTVKAKAVTGLTAVSEPSLEWLPEEQAAWAATSSWYTTKRNNGDLNEHIDVLRHGAASEGLRPAWVFVHGDEEVVAPLLASWDPTDLWDGEDTLKPIAARFGLAALPLLLRVVPRQPGSLAPLLLPYVDVDVARSMANWAVRLKSTATTARSWFARHGVAAAPLLVPDSVGKVGAARRSAEQALTLIATVHGDDVVREAARTYGAEAAASVDGLLAADPLERALPAKMPVLPGWAEPSVLPQIVVRSGGALPVAATRHTLMMLALSKPGEVYPGIASLTETATADSLAEFAWALFEQWRLANMPAKESWALHALALLGDDETVRRITPVLRSWPGEGAHHRAVEGLDVLASIGSDVALLHLHGISQRVKFKALKVRAQEKISEVAAGLGLTGEQLSDRLVPDFGLDTDGSTVVDYGTRSFTVGFDEQLRPYVLDGDGKRLKDLPKPGVRDDAELAPSERKRFMALKKDVRTIASDQVRRLEAAMVTGRSWTAQEFTELFVGHPLLWHLVRRLVWLSETDGAARTAFRVAEDRTFADAEDDVFDLPDDATVRLAHPLHLDDELTAWSEVFADYEILQPFPQLGRTVLALPEEESAGYRLARFEGLKVPIGKVLGLERRGWRRGTPQDAGVERWISKRLGDDCYLVIALDPGIAVGVVDMFPEQTLETVWLDDRPDDHWTRRSHSLRFAGMDAVTVSELLVDLAELTEGVAS